MKLIEYPVSLVMKAWHTVLAASGMDSIAAWPVTIVLLVITVRLILLPFAFRALHSSRILINLRPALAALEASYAGRTDRDSIRAKMSDRKELQRNAGYRMRDGCLPALIQIPIFLGLYRILLTVSRPQDMEDGVHQGIGALNGTDVGEFLQAQVFGVPLPAYSVMTDERFAFLGTSSSDVFHIALPLCLLASVLTTVNLTYSVRRNWMTLDENNAVARGLFKFIVVMVPFSLVFPLAFGLAGPAPVAIMCYWVLNNLWTVIQNIGLQLHLDRKVPYSEEFLHHRKEIRQQRKTRKKGPQGEPRQVGTPHVIDHPERAEQDRTLPAPLDTAPTALADELSLTQTVSSSLPSSAPSPKPSSTSGSLPISQTGRHWRDDQWKQLPSDPPHEPSEETD